MENTFDKVIKLLKEQGLHNSTINRFINEIKFIEDFLKLDEYQDIILKNRFYVALELFYEDIQERAENLEVAIVKTEKKLKFLQPYLKEFTVHYIGHAHQDINWLWPWNETVDAAYKTFSTVLKLMDEYPEFIFSQSQIELYKIIEDYYPELFEEIKEKVKSGRWEVTANTWVEGDKNLSSGESQIRQILYAKKYLKEKFNMEYDEVNIDWEPDLFGHGCTAPQILKQCGINHYYFCRAGRGKRLFQWEGLDGSRVIAWNDEKLWYNFAIKPEEVKEVISHYKETKMKDYMIVYGVGDHGGGPTRVHLNTLIEMKTWPLFPNVKFSTTKEYFKIAEKYKETLPIIKEELNFTFRGCYTSQSNIKKANRYSEGMLAQSEFLATLGKHIFNMNYPYSSLESAWRNTLVNQFHDIIPGSEIKETYQYAQGQYQNTKVNIDTVNNRVFNKISQNIGDKSKGEIAITVFNPNPWKRSEPVTVDVYERFEKDAKLVLFDNAGEKIKMQYHADNDKGFFDYHRVNFTAANIPACGYKTYYLSRTNNDTSDKKEVLVAYDGKSFKVIENQFLKVTVEAGSGSVTSVFDKNNNIEYLKCGQKLALLNVLEEAPNGMSAWDIEQILEKIALDKGAIIGVKANGPSKVSISSKYKYNNSTIEVEIALHDAVPRIDYILNIDWQEIGNKDTGITSLVVNFPIGTENNKVTYDIPFGAITREDELKVYSLSENVWNPSSLTNKGEDVPAQKYVDISGINNEGEKIGFCIVNDSKYGFNRGNNDISMSILRSSYWPDPYPEVGVHKVEFSVYPHLGEWSNGDSARCGVNYNQRLMTHYFEPINNYLKDEFEMLELFNKNIVISAIKISEDTKDILVRCYEVNGKETYAKIIFYLENYEVSEVNVLENEPLAQKIQLNKIKFNPFEVKTLRFKKN